MARPKRRPQKVPELEKGKTPYTVEGLTDYLNWIIWFMSRQDLDESNPEKPRIKGLAQYV